MEELRWRGREVERVAECGACRRWRGWVAAAAGRLLGALPHLSSLPLQPSHALLSPLASHPAAAAANATQRRRGTQVSGCSREKAAQLRPNRAGSRVHRGCGRTRAHGGSERNEGANGRSAGGTNSTWRMQSSRKPYALICCCIEHVSWQRKWCTLSCRGRLCEREAYL